MKELLLIDELTSPEVKSRIDAGYTTIIVPLGAMEQHGPALPLLVDNEHGLQTALRAARLVGNTLVGPVVTLGYSIEHTQFAGTVSLARQTLASIIHDVAESHARSGFRMVYFWIAHGGNNPVLQALFPLLESKWPTCFVTGIKNLDHYISQTWDKVPLEMGIRLSRSGSHAGEFETSMMLASRPELVMLSHAEAGNTATFQTFVDKMMAEGIHTVSPNGVLGDQRRAEAERGRYYLEKLAEYLASDLRTQREGRQNQGLL